MAKAPAARDRASRCPICGRPTARDVRPFCSRRCRDVDLARWLQGSYAIPVVEDDEEVSSPSEENR